jgi:hypothetical protein
LEQRGDLLDVIDLYVFDVALIVGDDPNLGSLGIDRRLHGSWSRAGTDLDLHSPFSMPVTTVF